jgi:hypothetical protein
MLKEKQLKKREKSKREAENYVRQTDGQNKRGSFHKTWRNEQETEFVLCFFFNFSSLNFVVKLEREEIKKM